MTKDGVLFGYCLQLFAEAEQEGVEDVGRAG